ncbi:MAG: hypothetical protein HYZ74_05025 [Elusimicrobia bacterium]|nr:hypothetical protein [Elusimicrobiota bacterium]
MPPAPAAWLRTSETDVKPTGLCSSVEAAEPPPNAAGCGVRVKTGDNEGGASTGDKPEAADRDEFNAEIVPGVGLRTGLNDGTTVTPATRTG